MRTLRAHAKNQGALRAPISTTIGGTDLYQGLAPLFGGTGLYQGSVPLYSGSPETRTLRAHAKNQGTLRAPISTTI